MADFEWVFIDGSIVRAHQNSTGAATESSEQIGKSRGGNSTKIHLAVVCGEELKIQGHFWNTFQLVFVFAKRLNYR